MIFSFINTYYHVIGSAYLFSWLPSSQDQRQWNTGRGNFNGEEKDWSPGKNKPRAVAENTKKSQDPRVNRKRGEGEGFLGNFAFMQHSTLSTHSVKNQSEDLAHYKDKDVYVEGYILKFLYLLSHFSIHSKLVCPEKKGIYYTLRCRNLILQLATGMCFCDL